MISFLSELAKEVYSEHGTHLDDVCVVFQNRRAGLYFKHFLAQEAKQTIWAPKVLTIEEFVFELNPVQIVEPVMLLFEFYSVYKKNGGSDSFEEFAQWGEILLKDFDEIDAYMVPADKLFHHLNEAKAIEQWNPESKALTDFQRRYLRFWESFEGLYGALRDHLKSRNKAYKGLALRQVAETIEDKIAGKAWTQIIFAGFNALSLSEETIFKTLLKLKRARMIWDMDTYYIRNEDHEAGHYIRKYLRDWKISDPRWEKDFLLSEKKNIHVIGVSKQVGQAKVAGDLVKKLQLTEKSADRTAVVLADETLLFPMLHSLPESIQDVNVSMGLSLKFTPIYSLIESLFNMQEHARNVNGNKDGDGIKFYYKDIIALLSHPLLQWADQQCENPSFRRLVHHIVKENILFLSASEIQTFITEINPSYEHVFFRPWTDSLDTLNALLHTGVILNRILTAEEMNKKYFELESLSRFCSVVRQLQSLLETHDTPLELKSLRILLTEILSSTRIPFSGEPLKGLQVMGMLETRTLDFENLIMLSVNENTLPASKAQQSMIPFDIKKIFQLPTYREKDAIFAYNFYRSIQRAKNIYLIYNSETDDFGKGEKSRFITQILHELPAYNPNIKPEDIQESFLSVETYLATGERSDEFNIKKNDEILGKLDWLCAKGLSPSALNSYINCTLQFYFRYIARLSESEEIEETIEASTFGSAVHYVLEHLFKPYEGKIIHVADTDRMFEKVPSLTEEAFRYFLKNGDLQHGKNYLLIRVAVKLIENFLMYEKKRIAETEKNQKTIRILALEKEVSCDFNLQLNDQKKIVKLKGKMDRIESNGDQLLVIDYKTGRVDPKELNTDSFSDLISDPLLAKSFQLLMYGYIYARSSDLVEPNMVSAIYPFKKLSDGIMHAVIAGNEILTTETFMKFEEKLNTLLGQMLDPKTIFRQTDDSGRCRNCEFISLCRRD